MADKILSKLRFMLADGICHVTFSTKGGAGEVANRLQKGQLDSGMQSRLLSMTDQSIPALKYSHPLLTSKALIDFYGVRRTRESHLFTLLRNGTDKPIHSELQNSKELLHLHWTPGVLDLCQIAKYAETRRGVVWTMHDMWPITGGCHHSLDCKGFEQTCSNCPQVRGLFQNRVAASLEDKRTQLNSGRHLYLVAPSRWMANRVNSSSAVPNAVVRTVPNPIDCDIFTTGNRSAARMLMGIPHDAFVIGCCAADLLDPMKNIQAIINGASILASKLKGSTIILLAVGSGAIESTDIRIHTTGLLRSPREVVIAYQSMDLFVSLSRAENFPLSVAEAAATGLPVICANVGGMPEIVVDGHTGIVLIERTKLEDALHTLAVNQSMRESMAVQARLLALSQFALPVVVQKYNSVYLEALSAK